MDADIPNLQHLWARLLCRDDALRQAAREEIQSWSYEKIARLLYACWPEGYDLPVQEPSGILMRAQRCFLPRRPSLTTTAMLDTLIGVCAEVSEDTRFVGLLLSVMANEQELKEKLRAGNSPHWGTHLNGSSSGFGFGSFIYPKGKNLHLEVLSRLLPLVTPANCDLSPRQRDALLIPLRYPYRDVDLTLSILVMLAWLGEANALQAVTVIEQGSIETDNGRRLRAAACACREQIELRVNKNRQAQILLRPADPAVISAPDALLRPLLDSIPEPCPEELLRPAD